MGRVLAYDQFNAASAAVGVASLPAGSTLLKARLACYTWFSSQNTTQTYQGAPPNTVLGISWVPHGTAVPIVDETNWRGSEWYVAGPGEMTAIDRWLYIDKQQAPNFLTLQHHYATVIELDVPLYEAGAFDLGVSMNFLGAAFWSADVFWLSYQFVAYFT